MHEAKMDTHLNVSCVGRHVFVIVVVAVKSSRRPDDGEWESERWLLR